jgi:hypothetical protein
LAVNASEVLKNHSFTASIIAGSFPALKIAHATQTMGEKGFKKNMAGFSPAVAVAHSHTKI